VLARSTMNMRVWVLLGFGFVDRAFPPVDGPDGCDVVAAGGEALLNKGASEFASHSAFVGGDDDLAQLGRSCRRWSFLGSSQ
jgi:hypothetical protein